MGSLPGGVWGLLLIAFIASIAMAWLQKPVEKADVSPFSLSTVKNLIFTLILPAVFFAIAEQQQWIDGGLLPYFLGGVLLPWTLARMPVSTTLRRISLLAAVVGTAVWQPELFSLSTFVVSPAMVLAWGILTAKVGESLNQTQEYQGWSDILPALTLLIGLQWVQVEAPFEQVAHQQALVLSAVGILQLTTVLMGRVKLPTVEHPLMNQILPGVFWGVVTTLMAAIFYNNLLLEPAYLSWAILLGSGIFLATLLQQLWANQNELTKDRAAILPVKMILLGLIGVATLVASRAYGTLGWVFLALAFLGYQIPGQRPVKLLNYAILFWVARVAIQIFTETLNLNVSGINLTHPYVSAALYGGLILMVCLSLLWRGQDANVSRAGFQTALLFGFGILFPLFGNYFLHVEAMGSFLIAALIGSLAVSVLGPFRLSNDRAIIAEFDEDAQPTEEPLLGLTAYMVVSAFVGSQLLTLGNLALREDQVKMMLIALAVSIVYSLIATQLLANRKSVEVR